MGKECCVMRTRFCLFSASDAAKAKEGNKWLFSLSTLHLSASEHCDHSGAVPASTHAA